MPRDLRGANTSISLPHKAVINKALMRALQSRFSPTLLALPLEGKVHILNVDMAKSSSQCCVDTKEGKPCPVHSITSHCI